jgi:hypothetical protein
VLAKPLKSNEAHTITPSLSLKFIGESILEKAQFAQTTFQAFELIVALTSIADFQLIVNLISAKRASKLIVINSKIPLHFSNKYRIFCEGELRQHVDANDDGIVAHQLTQIFHNNSNAAINQQLVGLGQTGIVSLIGRNSLVNHISHFVNIGIVGRVGHNSPVGFIGLGLIGFIGLSLISFVGLISNISLVGIGGFSCINCFIGLGLDGVIGLGLVSLVRLIDRISLVGPISFSGISGLVGQISLVNLSGISGISGRIDHNGLVGLTA